MIRQQELWGPPEVPRGCLDFQTPEARVKCPGSVSEPLSRWPDKPGYNSVAKVADRRPARLAAEWEIPL